MKIERDLNKLSLESVIFEKFSNLFLLKCFFGVYPTTLMYSFVHLVSSKSSSVSIEHEMDGRGVPFMAIQQTFTYDSRQLARGENGLVFAGQMCTYVIQCSIEIGTTKLMQQHLHPLQSFLF